MRRELLLLYAVLVATFLETLDATVVSVSLPYIAGSLSVTSQEAAWGVTAYLCANAIILPVASAITQLWGERTALIGSICLFGATSALCSLSTNVITFIAWRTLQGASGAILQPIAYAAALATFTGHRKRAGIAILGTVTTLAPTLGPVLGGWLTAVYGWQTIFVINLPLVAFVVVTLTSVYPAAAEPVRSLHRIDWTSILLLVTGVCVFQFLLNRGDYYGWYEAPPVIIGTSVCLLCALLFIARQLISPVALLPLRHFISVQYLSGCLFMFAQNVVLFASTLVLPLLLEQARGYSSLTTGVLILPRGLGAIAGMLVADKCITVCGRPLAMCLSFAATSAALLWLAALPLDVNGIQLGVPQFLAGVMSAVAFVATASQAFNGVAGPDMVPASACFGIVSNVGASLGVAIATTSAYHLQRSALDSFSASPAMFGPPLYERFTSVSLRLFRYGIHGRILGRTHEQITAQLLVQADVIAANEVYTLLALVVLALCPFTLAPLVVSRLQRRRSCQEW